MNLHQFMLILRARYRIALLVLIATVAATLLVSLLLPKQYTASAAVLLDVKSPDPVSGMALQGLMAPGYMATQIDIINSDRVAQSVVRLLRMDENATIRQQWQENTLGKGQLKDWLAQLLLRNLDVRPSRESNVISINYTGADPDFAAAVANAFVQAYIQVNVELRNAPAKEYAVFFEGQTRAARARLEQAQQVLSAYQQTHGITASSDQLDFETAKLNETSSQLTGVQGQTTDSQSKRASGKTDTLAEVMQSSLISSLKADIARTEARLNESGGNFGKNHPQTLRTEAELATLRSQLETEIQKITSSVDTTYQVGRQRERALQGSVYAQRSRVLALNRQRDELNVLRRDIESAQRAFETFSQRASQSLMESQSSQTNIAVLNPAAPPVDASRPRVLLNLVLAVLLGGLAGIGLALLLELLRKRVRGSRDITETLGLPILGAISSATLLLRGPSSGVRT